MPPVTFQIVMTDHCAVSMPSFSRILMTLLLGLTVSVTKAITKSEHVEAEEQKEVQTCNESKLRPDKGQKHRRSSLSATQIEKVIDACPTWSRYSCDSFYVEISCR